VTDEEEEDGDDDDDDDVLFIYSVLENLNSL
jgi:hypothetical protein